MKAGLTAAVAALEVLRDAGIRLRGDVILASVVDEEAGGMGTLALVDRGYRADGAIIPEPTELYVAPLCRGIVWGRLTIPGRAGHIEMPQPHWRDGGAVDAIALGRRSSTPSTGSMRAGPPARPSATRCCRSRVR